MKHFVSGPSVILVEMNFVNHRSDGAHATKDGALGIKFFSVLSMAKKSLINTLLVFRLGWKLLVDKQDSFNEIQMLGMYTEITPTQNGVTNLAASQTLCHSHTKRRRHV